MEICVLNPYFYPYKGGTEKVLLEVYSRLAKRHSVTVLTSTVPGRNVRRTEEINGMKVVRLKTAKYAFPGLPLPLESFKDLSKELRNVNAEIYHINNRYQYFPLELMTIKSIGKLALTIHNSLPKNINRHTDLLAREYDRVWGRRIMHQADLITCVSQNALNVTIPKRDKHKAHVVYNGVDYKNFRRHPRSNPKVARILDELGFEGKTILCNGRFVPQKGQLYLMHALRMASRRVDLPNLLLIGKGPMERELRLAAEELGISLQIRSDLDDTQLPYYYSACDVSAVPSLYEPASLAALESMSCELPVVASKVGGLPEMVGPCGLYARPRSPRSIAKALTEILSDPERARQMGKRGRKRMMEKHSWDRIARQYEELLLNTVEG